MKVILSVAENWHRTYLVEIPEDTPEEKWDNKAIEKYQTWYKEGNSEFVQSFGDPEYLDDGPLTAHIVTQMYED